MKRIFVETSYMLADIQYCVEIWEGETRLTRESVSGVVLSALLRRDVTPLMVVGGTFEL